MQVRYSGPSEQLWYGLVSNASTKLYLEIKAVSELGIDMITKLLNYIYIGEYIPDDLVKSTFIELPKKLVPQIVKKITQLVR